MVSFSCEICSDILKKPKLDSHASRCRGAYYTCIDCSTTFEQGSWKGHTSCVGEAEKYQGKLYQEKGKGRGKGGEKKGEGEVAIGGEGADVSIPDAQPEKEGKKDKKSKARKEKPAPAPAPAPASDAEVEKDKKSTTTEGESKKSKSRKDKKSRKSASDPAIAAEPTTKKRKLSSSKASSKKPKITKATLAEIVGEGEIGLDQFLEALGELVGPHDRVTEGKAYNGCRVRVDKGQVVLSYKEHEYGMYPLR